MRGGTHAGRHAGRKAGTSWAQLKHRARPPTARRSLPSPCHAAPQLAMQTSATPRTTRVDPWIDFMSAQLLQACRAKAADVLGAHLAHLRQLVPIQRRQQHAGAAVQLVRQGVRLAADRGHGQGGVGGGRDGHVQAALRKQHALLAMHEGRAGHACGHSTAVVCATKNGARLVALRVHRPQHAPHILLHVHAAAQADDAVEQRAPGVGGGNRDT